MRAGISYPEFFHADQSDIFEKLIKKIYMDAGQFVSSN
jgi:hypothetical protein